jgi:hypothetical protein
VGEGAAVKPFDQDLSQISVNVKDTTDIHQNDLTAPKDMSIVFFCVRYFDNKFTLCVELVNPNLKFPEENIQGDIAKYRYGLIANLAISTSNILNSRFCKIFLCELNECMRTYRHPTLPLQAGEFAIWWNPTSTQVEISIPPTIIPGPANDDISLEKIGLIILGHYFLGGLIFCNDDIIRILKRAVDKYTNILQSTK